MKFITFSALPIILGSLNCSSQASNALPLAEVIIKLAEIVAPATLNAPNSPTASKLAFPDCFKACLPCLVKALFNAEKPNLAALAKPTFNIKSTISS